MVNSVSGISTFLVNTFSNIPVGISGGMYQLVDLQRMYVQNYTGQVISSSSISEQFELVITNFALAQLVDMKIANGDGGTTTLGEMSVNDQGALLSATEYRNLANLQLKAIPRAVSFVRSISA